MFRWLINIEGPSIIELTAGSSIEIAPVVIAVPNTYRKLDTVLICVTQSIT